MTRQLPEISMTAGGRAVAAGQPVVFHCNHYNYWLQNTLRLMADLGMEDTMVDAAAESAHAFVREAAQEHAAEAPATVLALAADAFSEFGFGTIDFSGASAEGGRVRVPVSHYGQCLASAKDGGTFSKVQSLFDAGFAAGAVEAAFDLPRGSLAPRIVACHSTGAPEGIIELGPGQADGDKPVSPGVGARPSTPVPPPWSDTSVDEAAILGALATLDFSGNEEGLIPRFGVMLTRHFANYYDRCSYAFTRAMAGSGFDAEARELLVHTGYRCAFNTFGGIMTSAEWDAVVRPQLETREDWVHGMVAVVNALGWGTWRVASIGPDHLTVRLYEDYESCGYVGMFGQGEGPACFLAQGGVAGIMNLVHLGDIADKPTLDAAFFERVFESEGTFTARETVSLIDGAGYTEITATRQAA